MNPAKQLRAAELYNAGMSVADIARTLPVPVDLVWAYVNGGQAMDLQRRLGLTDDGKMGRATMGKLRAAVELLRRDDAPPTIPTGSAELRAVGSMPFGARLLDWMLAEARRWGEHPVSESRVAEYLSGCERDGKNIGQWLRDTELSKPGRQFAFCAAARGYSESQVALPQDGELPPWRAGALELWRDGVGEGRETHASEARFGPVRISPGDVAVYVNTQDATRGHIRTVIESNALGYRGVGANENGGRWVVDPPGAWRRYDEEGNVDGVQRLRLLGFLRGRE
jgi:hypothetical protein